jgi:hypothetical protein
LTAQRLSRAVLLMRSHLAGVDYFWYKRGSLDVTDGRDVIAEHVLRHGDEVDAVTTTARDRLAAELLGLSLSGLRRLRRELKLLRGEGQAEVVLQAPLMVYQDPSGKKVWEAEPTGIVTGAKTGLVVEFRFAVTVFPNGITLGMSNTPDKYTVRTADGTVLLDNVRVHCGDRPIEEDRLPWAAYDVFDPLRAVVLGKLTAQRITGELPIEIVRAEPNE